MESLEKKFTWVQTHKELVQYLAGKENEQKELVELLRESGVTAGLVDEDPKGTRFELEEIDPFSFFCFIYKYGPENRLQILQSLAKKLELHYPEDELGIPSAQAQKVMMFPFKDGRNNNEIENLWELFYSALDDSITDEQFEKILNQYGVGPVKITEALFYIAPDRYMPINGPVKPWLKQKLGIDPSFSTYTEYLELLDKIKQATGKPFYELSYDGWLWAEKRKKKDIYREKFQPLIEKYKHYLEEFGLEKEQYKWEAIHHFQQTFELEADDFTENFKSSVSKASNLVYQNSIGFIRKAVQYYPEDVRKMFRALYDEESSLEDRFSEFTKSAEELLPRVIEKHGKKLNHQQDERTLSYYLTMRFPEKYPLYKNETYQFLLSIMDNLDAKPAGEKYFHYLELTEKLIFVVESDSELIKMVESLLTEDCYQGEQKWIILQDILWINMRFINKANYWLFQGNPDLFDLKNALKEGDLSSWRVNTHKSRITPGDKVILWASGEDRGCYALAEVNSEVYEDSVKEAEVPYYKTESVEESFDQVELQITHNLTDNPVTEAQIKSDSRLADLKIGNQGTNFSATQEEFEAIMELIKQSSGDSKWNELVKVVQKIDDEKAVRKFFKTVKHVLEHFRLNPTNEITYASSINNYIQFTIGSRYVTHLQRKKEQVIQGFYVDNEYLDQLKKEYKSLQISDKAVPADEGEMTWVTLNTDDVNVEDFYDGIIALAQKGVERQGKSQFRTIHTDKHNPWIAKVALNDSILEKLLRGEKMEEKRNVPEVNYPLNTIFYGPPGTGKTYNTIKRAAEIVEGRVIENFGEAKEIFNNKLGENIEFITFHQNYSYEDFIQGLRPETEGSDGLTFEKRDGIFKKVADRAYRNLINSRKNQIQLNKTKAFINALENLKDEILETDKPFQINETAYFVAVEEDAFRYSADNWTLKGKGFTGFRMKYSDLIEFFEAGIESRKEIKELDTISGLAKQHASYFFKAYEIIKERMDVSEVQNAETEKKNYVLIIDEINRANISRVFGELITLIEPDKRSDGDIPLKAKLPSGDPFIVPSNLYLVGTMNTADKSIAQLDIALRRRFEFEAMYPLYNIPGKTIHDREVLEEINKKIIALKGHDFQIGHSYFMNGNLKERMNKKVIPLLMEYFMNDKKEVEDVLKSAKLEIEEDSWPLQITGKKL